MVTRNDKQVNGGLRVDVLKGERGIVLIDNLGGYFAPDKTAEKTIVHREPHKAHAEYYQEFSEKRTCFLTARANLLTLSEHKVQKSKGKGQKFAARGAMPVQVSGSGIKYAKASSGTEYYTDERVNLFGASEHNSRKSAKRNRNEPKLLR
jgi:hypothetical protein